MLLEIELVSDPSLYRRSVYIVSTLAHPAFGAHAYALNALLRCEVDANARREKHINKCSPRMLHGVLVLSYGFSLVHPPQNLHFHVSKTFLKFNTSTELTFLLPSHRQVLIDVTAIADMWLRKLHRAIGDGNEKSISKCHSQK